MAKQSALMPWVKSKVKTRTEASKLTLEQLEELTDVLIEVRKAKLNEHEQYQSEVLNQVADLVQRAELTATDVFDTLKQRVASRVRKSTPSIKPKKKVAPKYRIVVDGKEHLWTGRGRKPLVFQDYLAKGNSLESAAIGTSSTGSTKRVPKKAAKAPVKKSSAARKQATVKSGSKAKAKAKPTAKSASTAAKQKPTDKRAKSKAKATSRPAQSKKSSSRKEATAALAEPTS